MLNPEPRVFVCAVSHKEGRLSHTRGPPLTGGHFMPA